jgi:hypothetical protein
MQKLLVEILVCCSLGLEDTGQHGAIVIVVVCCQALSTINSHNLTSAIASVVRCQEEDGLGDLLGCIKLALEGYISGSFLQVGLVLFRT